MKKWGNIPEYFFKSLIKMIPNSVIKFIKINDAVTSY